MSAILLLQMANETMSEIHEKEIQQLKQKMQAEQEEKLNSQRTSLTAEKQVRCTHKIHAYYVLGVAVFFVRLVVTF